jgi:hypothetical protein
MVRRAVPRSSSTARPAAGRAGRRFPADADLPAKTARTDQALPGPVWRIGSQTRGLARPPSSSSSRGCPQSRCRHSPTRLPPPPCGCTHQNPLTWVYEAPQLSSDLIRRTGPGRLDQRHRRGQNRWGRIGLRRGCFEGFRCGTWPYGGRREHAAGGRGDPPCSGRRPRHGRDPPPGRELRPREQVAIMRGARVPMRGRDAPVQSAFCVFGSLTPARPSIMLCCDT